MRRAEAAIFLDEAHPIDVLEIIAYSESWDLSRDEENQITLKIKGSWREYALTIAWDTRKCSLRALCAFEMTPQKKKLSKLYETVNLVNTDNMDGTFIYSQDDNLMIYRNNLVIGEEFFMTAEELKFWVNNSIKISEKFYPTFQITCWGDAMPKDAISVAFGEIAGYA
jgi:hypothetical protein